MVSESKLSLKSTQYRERFKYLTRKGSCPSTLFKFLKSKSTSLCGLNNGKPFPKLKYILTK